MRHHFSVCSTLLATLVLILLSGCGAGEQETAAPVTVNSMAKAQAFVGVYQFNGPLIAYTPCTGSPNREWASRCTGYPVNEVGKSYSVDPLDEGAISCEPDGLVRINTRSLYDLQFSEEGADILIKYQFGDIVRRIHMGGEQAPENLEHSLHGYSIGEWMGDTLYIETSHLSHSYFAYSSAPTSDEARVIERWWPGPIEGSLMVDIVLDDPVYYDRPFIVQRREWTKTNLENIEPWDCVDISDVMGDTPDFDAFFN